MESDSPQKTSLIALAHWMFAVIIIYCLIAGFCQAIEEDSKPTPLPIAEQSQSKDISDKNTYAHYSKLKTKVKERIFHPIIVDACIKHDMDLALVKAVIMAESSYNPMAVSKKGARGLMQLMPATASALGVEDPFNPEHNINGGILHLKQLLKQFKGDLKLALAAYNAGSKRVKEHRGIPPYRATRYYVRSVLKYYQKYQRELTLSRTGKA